VAPKRRAIKLGLAQAQLTGARYTSTVNLVKALGGELKITAKFPEGTVEITQFEDVKKAAKGCVARAPSPAAFDFELRFSQAEASVRLVRCF